MSCIMATEQKKMGNKLFHPKRFTSRSGGNGDRMRWMDSITDSMNEFGQTPGYCEDRKAWCAAVHRFTE